MEKKEMALGLNTESSGGGDFTPVIKFDARAGRMFRVDREQTASGWETTNVEVTNGFQAVFDFDNLEVGWALFAAGVAPSWVMVKHGQPLPARPSDQHKQAFRLHMKLGAKSGGDVREFGSTAKAVLNGIDKVHDAYLAAKSANAGKLPVISLTGSKPIVSTGKGQSSTNYEPIFEVVKWVDRPPELKGTAAPAQVQAAPVPELEDADAEF
jgi:hypothetical protein